VAKSMTLLLYLQVNTVVYENIKLIPRKSYNAIHVFDVKFGLFELFALKADVSVLSASRREGERRYGFKAAQYLVSKGQTSIANVVSLISMFDPERRGPRMPLL
jgi:hypothetical protein